MKRVPQVFAIALFAGATTLLPTQDSEAWWGGGRDRDRWDDDRWYDGPGGWGGYPGGYGGYPGGWGGGYPGYGGYGGYPGYGGYGGYPGYGGGYGGYPGYGGYGAGVPAYGGGYGAPQSAPPASSYSEPSRSAP